MIWLWLLADISLFVLTFLWIHCLSSYPKDEPQCPIQPVRAIEPKSSKEVALCALAKSWDTGVYADGDDYKAWSKGFYKTLEVSGYTLGEVIRARRAMDCKLNLVDVFRPGRGWDW
jgi:hypothetical protein